ncbi:MAG: NAD-dependent epimerase/dehydratase family protein [Desulfobacteraceae bacterium]|nr:NAD-dependent epimerase/dehydratase family protein [Desulfobacteraceae bacterium]
MDIAGSQILITGAGGFIGGRTAERLFFDYGCRPRCLVRNLNKISRLARFPLPVVQGDVLDYASLLRAAERCDVIIHCAYGNSEDDELNARVTVGGTENVARAALQCGVKRLVHISTQEVYSKPRPAVVSEDSPRAPSGDPYGDGKLQAEYVCERYFRENGLPVVMLRPTIVYGPYAPSWTVRVIERIRNGSLVCSPSFTGTANPVYIDDVVQAIFCAIRSDDVAGEAFNVSGGEAVPWNDFFASHQRLLGIESPKTAGSGRLLLYRETKRLIKPVLDFLKNRYKEELLEVYERLRKRGLMPNMKAFMQKGNLLAESGTYASAAFFPIEKARRCLGFEPRTSYAEGLEILRHWLVHISLIEK